MSPLGMLGAAIAALVALVSSCFAVQPYEVPPGSDLFVAVEGAWDWDGRPETCADNPHTISFTPDRGHMILTYPQPIDSATGRREARYAIQDVTRSWIRGNMLGETRQTESGELVVWDLVLTGPDSYRWHRADLAWNELGFSAELVRCPDAPPPPAIPADSSEVAEQR